MITYTSEFYINVKKMSFRYKKFFNVVVPLILDFFFFQRLKLLICYKLHNLRKKVKYIKENMNIPRNPIKNYLLVYLPNQW